jgi:hypothetical protein
MDPYAATSTSSSSDEDADALACDVGESTTAMGYEGAQCEAHDGHGNEGDVHPVDVERAISASASGTSAPAVNKAAASTATATATASAATATTAAANPPRQSNPAKLAHHIIYF